MYSVTLLIGKPATPLSLMFRDVIGAENLLSKFQVIEASRGDGTLIEGTDLFLEFQDDFGNKGTVASGEISAVLIVDLDANSEADIERGMVQARGQAKAQIQARNDPVLRAAALTSGIPLGGQHGFHG